jgi:hypothetical protein
MRQLLIRVPDDLHQRLTRLARHDGVSVNALANQILSSTAAEREPDDRRHGRAREKARELGLLADSTMPPLPRSRIDAALASTKGLGPVVEELWSDGR